MQVLCSCVVCALFNTPLSLVGASLPAGCVGCALFNIIYIYFSGYREEDEPAAGRRAGQYHEEDHGKTMA